MAQNTALRFQKIREKTNRLVLSPRGRKLYLRRLFHTQISDASVRLVFPNPLLRLSMRHNLIRKKVKLHSHRHIDSSLFVDNSHTSCTLDEPLSFTRRSLKASQSFRMFTVHTNRQGGNGFDTSAFRFTLNEGEREFGQMPRSQFEAQTKVLNKTMSKDHKLDHLQEKAKDSDKSMRNSIDEDENEEPETKDCRNLTETFVAVIAQGILSVPSKRMTLSSIYNFIAKTFPHFDKEKGPGWRNSVRHNLSSNDCFVKASRAENGKGHYWMIHPKDLPEFSKGNFRRPRKPRRPRCSHALGCGTDRSMLGLPLSATLFPYHHKPSHSLEFTKPHPPKEPFPHPFGVTPNRSPLLPTSRYDYYSREAAETAHFPMNQYHGFSTPPPPYGLFSWQDNPAFRNYNPHFQSSSFHPYLYMSPVSQSENGIGINYA